MAIGKQVVIAHSKMTMSKLSIFEIVECLPVASSQKPET